MKEAQSLYQPNAGALPVVVYESSVLQTDSMPIVRLPTPQFQLSFETP